MRICRRALATFAATLPLIAIVWFAADAAPSAPDWPQSHSDLSADPSITFGVLPNGMRYLIRHNESPPGAVSLWFAVSVGSLQQADDETGVAHFLEHMAFRGSKNFADGEALKVLQSVGVSLGVDANASTVDSGTAFFVTLPRNDQTSLDKAMLFFRDVASHENIDEQAVESERAVVMAEERQKATARWRGWRARMAAVDGAQLARGLDPGGTDSDVQKITAEELRAFYRAWYRPERATLFIVGDVDPKSLAKMVGKAFGDWRDASPAPVVRSFAPPILGAPIFTTFSEPGAANEVDFSWATPHDDTLDTRARERRDLVRLLGLMVLNQRFFHLANQKDGPFVGAAATFLRNPGADMTLIGATLRPGGALRATRAMHGVYADLLRDGVKPDELDRAVRTARVQLQGAAVAASSTPTTSLVGQYVGASSHEDVLVSPQTQLELFEEFVKTLRTDEVTTALRVLLTEQGPAVFVSSPTPIEGGEAVVASAFAAPPDETEAEQLLAHATWPYASFGPNGEIASRADIADLDATQVTFANGVHATIKHTGFVAGQVIVLVRFGKGRLGLPKARQTPVWALPLTLLGGGLARIDNESLSDVTAGRNVGIASLDVLDNAFVLRGATRPEDYTFELQLLAAQLTDPGWRPEGVQRGQSFLAESLTRTYASPSAVLGLQLPQVMHDGDPRWHAPVTEDVHAARLEDIEALLRAALADSAIEVTVVGDISVDDAVKGLQSTFGALPQHFAGPVTVVGDERLPVPGGKPTVLTHKGDASRALAAIAWPTVGMFPDMQTPRTLRVLELIMAQRALDSLRTQAGMTYSPSTSTYSSEATPGYGYVGIAAEIPLARIPDFYRVVAQMTADLRAKEVTVDELGRARDPRVQDLARALQTNGYWAGYLSGSQGDPRKLDLLRSMIPDMQRVTPADVLQAAQTYLTDEKAMKLVIVPEGQSGSVTTTMR
jgi:zinc protease